MKAKYALIIATLMLLFSFSLALAEDSDDNGALDATMRLMDDAEAESSNAVTKPIELPQHLRDREDFIAVEKSENGLETANAGSDNSQHSEIGRGTAASARDRANEMAEAAKDNRDSHGRSDNLPDPPNRPDPPNPGEPPG